MLFVLSVPLLLGALTWTARHGQPQGVFINAAVIVSGLFMLGGAYYDERYRHYWGWGLATLVFGLVMPLGTYRTAGIFAGCWLVMGGLLTASIMAWSLRKETRHGRD